MRRTRTILIVPAVLALALALAGSSQGSSRNKPPKNRSLPTVSGKATVGGSLTTTTGKWAGSKPLTFALQWQRCTEKGESCSPIDGATGPSYTVTPDDAGVALVAAVMATNPAGEATALSAPTAVVPGDPGENPPVASGAAPVNASLPTVSGSFEVGETLTTTPGSWTGTAPVTFAYHWQRCDSTAATSCSDVDGATLPTYVLTDADAASYLRVRVSATNTCASGCSTAPAVYSAVSTRAIGASAATTSTTGSLYVSTTGSDGAPCTQTAPCRSLDRAYHVAKPGQVVVVKAGSYPSQTLNQDPSKSAPAVVFQADTGASVTLSKLVIHASYVDVRSLTITGIWYVGIADSATPQASQPHDVTLRNLTTARMYIAGASDVAVLGGSIGPSVDLSSEIKACGNCTYVPTNIVLDKVTFHDYTRVTVGGHMECLHVYPARSLTIRNSRFLNCAVMDLFLENYGLGGDLRDVTLENNVFDQPGSHAGLLSRGYVAVNFAARSRTITNVRIAYNSLLVGDIPGANASGVSNFVVEGNVAPSVRCYAGVTYRYNVWTNWRCGITDRVAPTGFADTAHYNFQPVAGAASINAGDLNAYPSTDAIGRARYLGVAPDAGAYEAG
jgi:hypothetical protein